LADPVRTGDGRSELTVPPIGSVREPSKRSSPGRRPWRGDDGTQDHPAESPPPVADPGCPGADHRLRDGGAVRPSPLAIERPATPPRSARPGLVRLARTGDERADALVAARRGTCGANCAARRPRPRAHLGGVGLAVHRDLLDPPGPIPHPIPAPRLPIRGCTPLRT